jgi:hypothetical protein
MRKRALCPTGVELSKTDRALTLSTCINNGRDRFMVMGKLEPVE